ncbi:hypothetical protein N658DRAFT_489832 [Parathielavia hyrcaniae]|uniref:Uncharacterized protein n=1 Tax=Parathielavia hyrcaniae TaxID=113614 RepID=A0AAN6PRH5_9PEZI|nr:hypothetical protein N658DRAFT_489832 [Parathielavia hyrcaniae]
MHAVSRILQVILRVWQFICSIIVLGILAQFLHVLSQAAWPADFALFVMWLVFFCLLITRTGVNTCFAHWLGNYWEYHWGRWWRGPFGDVGYTGCSYWRTGLAFSFLAMFAFLITTILIRPPPHPYGVPLYLTHTFYQGAYVVSKWWTKRRSNRRNGTGGQHDLAPPDVTN